MPKGGPRPGSGRPRKDGLPIGSPRAKRVRKKAPGSATVKPKTASDPVAVAPGSGQVDGHTGIGGATVQPAASTKPKEASLPDGVDPATGKRIDPAMEPAELLKLIAMNPAIDVRIRVQAATNAAPYFTAKKGESKKKALAGDKPQNPYSASRAPLKAVPKSA